MDLEPRTRAVVNKASMAFVKSEGLLGDKYVEVSFGKPDAEPVKDGDTIQSKPPIDISDLIQKTDRILSSTDDAMQHVQATSNNLQELTTRINEGKGSVGALINDRTLYQQASAGVTAFQEDMEALKHNFLVRGFFRNRGYEDATEIKKHAISKLPPTPPVGDFVLDATKMFAKEDSAKLRNQKVMEPAGHFLESHPFGLAVVAASTGEKGDTEKSRTLSEARAAVVREYLAQHFRVDDTRIKTLAVGKTGEPGDKPKIEIVAYAVAR
jgi:outer membrane protein OmpA-like peptidoglycan-associated protein